jgi:hypothetical protein
MVREQLVSHYSHQGNEPVAGTITLVYDHHKRNIQTLLTDIQHDHNELIVATMHVHLDHDNCQRITHRQRCETGKADDYAGWRTITLNKLKDIFMRFQCIFLTAFSACRLPLVPPFSQLQAWQLRFAM